MRKYLLGRERALERDLLPLGNPRDKDVLVFGCGTGVEILWCAAQQARSALGIDQSRAYRDALVSLLETRGQAGFNYDILQGDVQDLALDRPGQFDLIVSNGVFEHVSDMRGVLNAMRKLLRPKGRIATYADGLWFSSIGGHLGLDGWEHLCLPDEEIRQRFPDRWRGYKRDLNRMTCIDFMSALRDVGAVILQFKFRTDPNVHRIPEMIETMRAKQEVSPTDLSIVSIGCEICFVENL